MEGHDFIGGSQQLSTNEYSRYRRATPHLRESLFHFPAFRVMVNLINQRVHPDFLEQNFDCITQATCALDEYHYPLIRGQSQHLIHVVTPD